MSTTHVVVIMDESGSMAGHEDDVVGGFNKYVSDLLDDGNTYKLTVTKFHTAFRPIVKDVDLKDVPLLRSGKRSDDVTVYSPEGWTALYDAVGRTLRNFTIPDGDKAIVLIMTDGKENSSSEFTAAKVRAEVDRLTATGQWAFLFIGEQMDAWAASAAGAAMGVGQTVSTEVAYRGYTMAAVAQMTPAYASGAVSSTATASATADAYVQELRKDGLAPSQPVIPPNKTPEKEKDREDQSPDK